MQYFNLHTHTSFCDGSHSPEEYVKEAVKQNFSALGFSAHAPLPFPTKWNLKEKNVENYLQEIEHLKAQYYQQIPIFLGYEADFIPHVTKHFSVLKKQHKLDYIIGSVHLVPNSEKTSYWFIDGAEENYINGLEQLFGNDIQKAVKSYYNQVVDMIISQKIDIIGHFDKIKMNNKDRFFLESEKWYQDLLLETIIFIEKSGYIVEVNTRGIYKNRCPSLYPGEETLHLLCKKNIPITLSSDAHSPTELAGYFPETIYILKNIGFRHLFCLNKQGKFEKHFLE